MDTSPEKIRWLTEINTLKKRGAVLCPLMMQEPFRFRPTLCLCDIPNTQALFLAESGIKCHDHTNCLPRIASPEEASSEVNRSNTPMLRKKKSGA